MKFTENDFKRIRSLKDVEKLNGHEFEWFCKFFLKSLGYTNVWVTKKLIKGSEYKYDRGVDITCQKDGKNYLVQCKHWHEGGSKDKDHVTATLIRSHAGVVELWKRLDKKDYQGIVIATVPIFYLTKAEAKILGIEVIDIKKFVSLFTKTVLN